MLCFNMGDYAIQTIFTSNLFLLRTNHKPLEWLTIVYDVNGRRGRWIFMLQDFHFKILHRLGNKHQMLMH